MKSNTSKLVNGVNLFDHLSSTLLLFDNPTYAKCILPERSCDEYIRRLKSTLPAGCKILGVKTETHA